MKVFLGGTCNESAWREQLIDMLEIDYFNPVVDDWNEECYLREIKERKECEYCLYVITPLMTGVYSIAEVVDDSNKKPEKTLFCILDKDVTIDNMIVNFDEGQIRSLRRVGIMVENNGGHFFNTLKEVADFLNEKGKINA